MFPNYVLFFSDILVVSETAFTGIQSQFKNRDIKLKYSVVFA